MHGQAPSCQPGTGLTGHRLMPWQVLRRERLEARLDAIDARMAALKAEIDTVLTLLRQ